MINNIFSSIKSSKLFFGFFALLAPIAVFGGAFLLTAETVPYNAELAFVEVSNSDGVLGSVVPASCESNPPDWLAPGPCVCNISASACSGPSCVKSVSVNTSYDYNTWGAWNFYRDGAYVTSVMAPSWGSSFAISPSGSTFTVTRPDGIAICSAFVAGPPTPSITIAPSPSPINPGDSTTLSWTVANATTCTASGGWSGTKSATGGSEVVTPAVTTTYSLTCSGPGGSVPRSTTVVVNPPVMTFTATPTLIGPGDSADLDWTVVGATSCTASGGWTGVKSTSGGTESVSPSVTTSYSLSCTGPSGVTNRTATVTLPSGFIAATPCVIPLEGASCNSTVVWNAYNFLGTPSVRQEGSEFSSLASNTGIIRAVTPSSTVFTLKDSSSAFSTTFNADIQCAAGSVWAGSRCVTLPVITIEANPDIIRSGATAPIDIEIIANYELTCTLSGGLSTTFTHTGSPSAVPYNYTTRPLTSAQITRVDCVSPTYPQVNGNAEVRIEVIPTVEEI